VEKERRRMMECMELVCKTKMEKMELKSIRIRKKTNAIADEKGNLLIKE
jgi:hypothetical protein